jgi:uncharacterized protein involved in outer membrane biogenesis
MAETEIPKQQRNRSSWARKLAAVAASLLVLLVVLYFVLTSSAFIKSVVLPRVAKAINADLTVQDLGLSPFSQLLLRKVSVKTIGPEPLVVADEVRVRYKLFSILGGNIEVDEIFVATPTVHIVQEADGTSNLDPLLKSDAKKPDESSKPAKAPQLNIRNVALKNATIHFTKKEKDGSSQTTELSNVDLTLDQLKNGQPGKAALAAGLKLTHIFPQSAKATNDVLEGKVTGAFSFLVDGELLPKNIDGNARFDVSRTEGAFSDLAGLSGSLQAQMTPSEIKQLSLRFERGGQGLGELSVSGPLDLAKTEGKLKVDIKSIDRSVLNLFGAAQGWDFANSKLDSANTIEIGQNGSLIVAEGKVVGQQIGIRQDKQSTPALDLNVDYKATVNLNQKTAVVQTLSLLGKQNQKDLLRASLDRPMNLNWGNSAQGLPDSTFQLSLQQLNLKDWQAMLGTNLPSGRVDLQLNIQAQKDGKQLTTKLSGHIQELALKFGTNAIDQAELKFEASGQIEDLKVIALDQYQFEARQKGRLLAKATGSARYDLAKSEINSQSVAEVSLTDVLQQFSLPDLSASSGLIKSTSTFTQKNDKQTATGNLTLSAFTGRYADYQFQNFQSAIDYAVDLAQQAVQIQRVNVAFSQGAEAGGSLELAGRYSLTNHAGQITFKLLDLNQNALRPMLAASLGPMKLVSASLNGSGSATYDPSGDSAVKADVNLANCVIDDPQLKLPRTPLSAQFKLDSSLRQQLVDLRQLIVTLRQGNESAGNIDLTGRYNLTNQVAQVAFKAVDLNQNALRPFMASALGANKLVSINVNANGTASYDPKADSAVKADLSVANWVVEDSQKKLPRPPLSAQVKLDGSLRQQILDLRQFAITLSPTQRAQNQFQAKGRLDLNKTNATPSQITLQAESLDVTPYYDMFAGTGTTNATPTTPSPQTAKKETEPAPVELPFQQFTADLKVDRFYLRDLAITNLVTTARINRGELTVKPLQMTLNGAPVNASAIVNLSVPGYKYDLSFQADKVPLEPLVNSFSTNSTGRLQGELIAQAQLRGSGVTGASLQKSLAGQLSLSLTNLNLEIVGKKIKRLLEPIALVLRVPELTQTPLNWVNAKADIGQGTIKVNQFAVLSHAFYADGQGTVRIAEVLTNSPLDIPITVSLRRSLAEKSNLIPAGAPTNTVYVALPTFAKLDGTLGDPKTEINKVVISGLLLRSAAGIPQVGDKAGNILQGIGGILSGQKPPAASTNNIGGTNSIAAPKTNKPPRLNPLDLLELIPKKK